MTGEPALFEPIRVSDPEHLPQAVRRRLLPQGAGLPPDIAAAAAEIVDRVRHEGDTALVDYTARFDGVTLTAAQLRVSDEAVAASARAADPELRRSIDALIANVERFHRPQHRSGYALDGPEGSRLAWRLRPAAAAAVYVPGGSAAYPTSVVMNLVPARIAGVPRLVVLTPPGSVERNPAIAYALQALAVSEIIGVGGAQAIAAAAYGTQTVAPVDVIVGPGNAYVAAAKRLVFGQVGIDAVAGPSEVAILADESAPAEWVAADLLAQAEHDALARCVLVTPSASLAEAVAVALRRRLEAAPRRAFAEPALADWGVNAVVPDLAAGVALVNAMAPEHLQVMVAESAPVTPEALVAGAIFWGPHSPTAVGDYWAGPNHVLPTGGSARFRGPLGVDDFLVPTSLVRYTASAARGLDPAVRLAESEGLPAHAASLALRGRSAGGDGAEAGDT